jgi:hypothetical protein
MIKDGSIHYINRAFIEFHSEKMTIEEGRHTKLIGDLSKIDGLDLSSILSNTTIK